MFNFFDAMKKTLLPSLFVGIILIFSGCGQNVPEKQPVDTQASSIEQESNQQSEEIEQPTTAEGALITFFDYLSKNEFAKASKLFSSDEADWESLKVYSPIEETSNKAKVLENYCKATLTCLKAKVLDVKEVANGEYNLVVQFLNNDGTTYIFGPCCGATEKEKPSKDKFDYTVKKINSMFKVITPPLYRP
jgi:hypothetical protein